MLPQDVISVHAVLDVVKTKHLASENLFEPGSRPRVVQANRELCRLGWMMDAFDKAKPPGESASIVSLCLSGETAVSGGPTGIPAPPIFVAWSTVVFDGGPLTGWQALFQNGGTQTLTVTPRTSALCAPGSMTLG